MNIQELIKKISEHPSPTGFEHNASKRIAAIMERYLDTVSVDKSGNVIGYRSCGKKNAKCLLLDAHLDEIGLIVTGEKEGFLTFTNIGGVDPRILPATCVTVLSNPPRSGVITSAPPHLQSAEESDKTIPMDSLYIDVGADGESGIPVGTPVVFDSGFSVLSGKNISARALDDRASLVAILRAIDLLKGKKLGVDIAVVASCQEELGCRGASVAGYTVNPDVAIVVDVTHATTPGVDKSISFTAGSGAAIGIGPNMTRKVSDALITVAKDKKIPHTVEISPGHSGTNAYTVQVLREGIATGLISIPLKYMHTPVETVKEKDIEAVAKLISEFAQELSSGGVKL